MQRLSAIDAISPTWEHTRELLLAPRRWTLLLKVAAVAFFAQMGGCSGSFSSPGRGMPHGGPALSAAVTSFLIVAGFVVLLIGLVMLYAGSRLQLVLFELVARRDTTVAPIWRRYGGLVWKWIGLKLLFFVVALACLLPVMVPLILHFIHTVPKGAGAHGAGLLFATVLEFIGVIFVAVLLFSCGYILLTDFAIPSLALENTSLREAIRRIVLLVRGEPGQVALYVLMRLLLLMAWVMCSYLAILVAVLILLAPLGGIGAILWATLRHAGPAGHVMMVMGWVVLGAVLVAAVIFALIVLLGSGLVFIQAYAIYFLGGRYPLLARLLEPGPGTPFTPPPVFPSEREEAEDDDGPSLPMNPAVA